MGMPWYRNWRAAGCRSIPAPYPLLRRLEKQGLLASVWDTSDSKPRKYYRRTPYGDAVYEQLRAQWRQMAAELDRLLEEETP